MARDILYIGDPAVAAAIGTSSMRPLLPFAVLALLLSAGCAPETAAPDAASPQSLVAEPAQFRVEAWRLPADGHAAQPDLVLTPDGGMLLSWVEEDATHAGSRSLKFARFADGRWSGPQAIASGQHWLVSSANTPHVAATADGALWAHWLQKAGTAKYASDVALVRSGDGGATWSAPVLVNDDGTATEHGFVSLWPVSDDSIGVAWLDGRLTAKGGDHGVAAGEHEGHAGVGHASAGSAMMTLRTTVFDAALGRRDEQTLDLSTCDCCQTDAVPTADGVMLAYRDRDAAEIRDIYIARFGDGAWQSPRRVHSDEWTMPACPVNGPAIGASAGNAVVGWYTAPGGTPMVKVAHSRDAGASFASPRVVDSGEAVQGRVAVALDQDAAWMLWLREADGKQSLRLARFSPDLSPAAAHRSRRAARSRPRHRVSATGVGRRRRLRGLDRRGRWPPGPARGARHCEVTAGWPGTGCPADSTMIG